MLSSSQVKIHERAVSLSREYSRLERELVEVLREVDKSRLFRRLNCRSLFGYATKLLGLSEAVAYSFINVARKTAVVADLREAIESRR